MGTVNIKFPATGRKEGKMENENIVKKVCKELGVTQKELAEMLGIAEVTANKWSSKPADIPQSAIKTLELIIENKKLKKQLEIVELFKNYIING